jgi:hypothetical protein
MGCAGVAALWLLATFGGACEPANNCSMTLTCDNSNSMLSSVPRPAFVSPDGELADLFIQGSYEAIMVEGGGFFNSTNGMIRVDILKKVT